MNFDWVIKSIESFIIGLTDRKHRVERDSSPNTYGLGRIVESGNAFSLGSDDLAKHCYILGATGCGKTSLILKLIEQDLKGRHSLVVIDLRGDLVSGALNLCASLEIELSRVKLIDLRSSGFAGFNPLSGAGEPFVRALHLLDVLSSESESWGVQLEETLRSALLLLAGARKSIVELERLFYDNRFRNACLNVVSDEALIAFWARYEELSPEKRQSWALPVLNKVTPLLAVPVLREVLGAESPIDLGEFTAKPGTVLLVSLAVDELHRSSRMVGSLIVSALSREMMARVNVPERKRNPVRLYVDEFESMASESFEGLIAEGRRFGLTLVLSHQTLSQLPLRLRSVIRNNVGVQIVFQCGFEDARTVARELPEGIEVGSLRVLEVGEAYVVNRAGEAVLTKFAPPRKQLPDEDVATLRAQLKSPAISSSPSPYQPAQTPRVDLRDLL